MLAVQDVAQALTATRTEFGTVFLQAQAQADIPTTERQEFEAIAAAAPDRDAFAGALQYAQAHGFFDALVNLILDERLENGHLTRLLMEEKVQQRGDAALQAMTDLALGFEQPDVVAKGIADGIRWTAKVLVDGQFEGTGILIAPHLVLTAWHVVKQVFTLDAGGSWQPIPDAGNRLTFVFDDFLARVDRGAPFQPVSSEPVPAHQSWCVVFSSCHNDELAGRLPADLTQLKGRWDYVLIRLARPLASARSWASLDPKSVVPRANERIFVFQHPAGQPLRLADDVVAAADAALRAVVPAFRFLHYANTVGGSSGGPCFDKTFALFGFHQGEWINGAPNGRVTNRGVPIVRVLEHVKAQITELPALDPSDVPIWSLGPANGYAPVIGTESFQSIVWRAAIGGAPRVLVIGGASGSGKTFRANLLSSMLPDGSHLKLLLRAEAIAKASVLDLAARICAAAGAELPSIAPLADANSTAVTWLKSEVASKIITTLGTVRKDRRVWLILTDLNAFDIEDPHASQLLLLLYEQSVAVDWLRVVLDGMKGDLPLTVGVQTERHRVPQVSLDDIQAYFRHFRDELKLADSGVMSDVDILVRSQQLLRNYERALDATPDQAISGLATEIMTTANDYLAALAALAAGHN